MFVEDAVPVALPFSRTRVVIPRALLSRGLAAAIYGQGAVTLARVGPVRHVAHSRF